MDIEEIKEENLDSPLVVHKKDDASYQEANTEVSMQNTHVDEDSDMPTLERHRFKKEKKKKKLSTRPFVRHVSKTMPAKTVFVSS